MGGLCMGCCCVWVTAWAQLLFTAELSLLTELPAQLTAVEPGGLPRQQQQQHRTAMCAS
jgi:hypothetical protein